MPTRLVTAAQFRKALLEKEDLGEVGVIKFPHTEIKAISEAERTVDFVISTPSVDRERDTISIKGWKLGNFRRNPVVLFAHNSGAPPIAQAPKVRRNGDALESLGTKFTTEEENPFGAMIFRMIRGKFLRATSVGFLPLKFEFADSEEDEGRKFGLDFLEQELLEFSVVPVPANPEALITNSLKAGIDLSPLGPWCERVLDDWEEHGNLVLPRDDVETLWKGSADRRPRVHQMTKAQQDRLRERNLELAREQQAEDEDVRCMIPDHDHDTEDEAAACNVKTINAIEAGEDVEGVDRALLDEWRVAMADDEAENEAAYWGCGKRDHQHESEGDAYECIAALVADLKAGHAVDGVTSAFREAWNDNETVFHPTPFSVLSEEQIEDIATAAMDAVKQITAGAEAPEDEDVTLAEDSGEGGNEAPLARLLDNPAAPIMAAFSRLGEAVLKVAELPRVEAPKPKWDKDAPPIRLAVVSDGPTQTLLIDSESRRLIAGVRLVRLEHEAGDLSRLCLEITDQIDIEVENFMQDIEIVAFDPQPPSDEEGISIEEIRSIFERVAGETVGPMLDQALGRLPR